MRMCYFCSSICMIFIRSSKRMRIWCLRTRCSRGESRGNWRKLKGRLPKKYFRIGVLVTSARTARTKNISQYHKTLSTDPEDTKKIGVIVDKPVNPKLLKISILHKIKHRIQVTHIAIYPQQTEEKTPGQYHRWSLIESNFGFFVLAQGGVLEIFWQDGGMAGGGTWSHCQEGEYGQYLC